MSKPIKRSKKNTELDREVTVTLKFGMHGDQHHVENVVNRVARMLSVEMHKPVEVQSYVFTNGKTTITRDGNANSMEVPSPNGQGR